MCMKPWEFWPTWIFYPPILLWILWLCIRHWMLPNEMVKANPAFAFGGLGMSSKQHILEKFFYAAESELIKKDWDEKKKVQSAVGFARKHGVPVIVKPDTGCRGDGVKLLKSKKELEQFVGSITVDHQIQKYYPYEHELGVFYYRMPKAKKGKIFSITRKILPRVVGDGRRSVQELIDTKEEFMHRKDLVVKDETIDLHSIPKKNEKVLLSPFGNHCKGAIFKDGMDLWTQEFEDQVDRLAKKVPGFYFGRFDVKVKDVEKYMKDISQGRIIELNGVIAEATHVYDSTTFSLFAAYKIMFKQWDLVFRIAKQNKKEKGVSMSAFLSNLREYLKSRKTYA
jgi:hypothetical protein